MLFDGMSARGRSGLPGVGTEGRASLGRVVREKIKSPKMMHAATAATAAMIHARLRPVKVDEAGGRDGTAAEIGLSPLCRFSFAGNRGLPASCGRGAHRRLGLVGHRDEPGASGWSVLHGFAGLAQLLPAVGQQLLDPTRRVGADPVEHVAEVRLRVDPQGLARRAQAHQHGRRPAPSVAPREQPVLPLMLSSA